MSVQNLGMERFRVSLVVVLVVGMFVELLFVMLLLILYRCNQIGDFEVEKETFLPFLYRFMFVRRLLSGSDAK